MASPLDIALRKIVAIGQRGAKKDFIDLYAIAQHLPLSRIFARAPEKFGERFAYMHFLRSLVWFEEADPEPDLPNWKGPDWEHIKRFFRTEAAKIAAEMGLES